MRTLVKVWLVILVVIGWSIVGGAVVYADEGIWDGTESTGLWNIGNNWVHRSEPLCDQDPLWNIDVFYDNVESQFQYTAIYSSDDMTSCGYGNVHFKSGSSSSNVITFQKTGSRTLTFDSLTATGNGSTGTVIDIDNSNFVVTTSTTIVDAVDIDIAASLTNIDFGAISIDATGGAAILTVVAGTPMAIDGSLSLTAGSSTDYSVLLDFNSGDLNVGDAGADINLTAGAASGATATLDFDGADITVADAINIIASTSALAKLDFNGTNFTVSGLTTITAAASGSADPELEIDATGTVSGAGLTLAGDLPGRAATLDMNSDGTFTGTVTVSGSAIIDVATGKTLTLSGSSMAVPAGSINAFLDFRGGGAMRASGTVTVTSGSGSTKSSLFCTGGIFTAGGLVTIEEKSGGGGYGEARYPRRFADEPR